jgi:hypothetical protein
MQELAGRGGPGEVGETCAASRTILVICPTHRDVRELPLVSAPGTTFLYHEYASASLEDLIGGHASDGALAADPLAEIDRILAKIEDVDIAGVVSTDDYPGSALAAIVAKELGLPGPEPEIVLFCQHKYLSRVAQARHVPEAVPSFALIDTAEGAPFPSALSFPAFVKPVKSFFSIGARMVGSAAELAALKPRWAKLDQFFLPLERLLERYVGRSVGSARLIAEARLKGEQVTVEGFAYRGEVTIMGVVDNIEMMYDRESDRISIIEINPRMASQFADQGRRHEQLRGPAGHRRRTETGISAQAGALRLRRELCAPHIRGSGRCRTSDRGGA